MTPATLFDSFLYRFSGINFQPAQEQWQGASTAKRDTLAVSHFFKANLFQQLHMEGLHSASGGSTRALTPVSTQHWRDKLLRDAHSFTIWTLITQAINQINTKISYYLAELSWFAPQFAWVSPSAPPSHAQSFPFPFLPTPSSSSHSPAGLWWKEVTMLLQTNYHPNWSTS